MSDDPTGWGGDPRTWIMGFLIGIAASWRYVLQIFKPNGDDTTAPRVRPNDVFQLVSKHDQEERLWQSKLDKRLELEAQKHQAQIEAFNQRLDEIARARVAELVAHKERHEQTIGVLQRIHDAIMSRGSI